jgi:hypothetical protein
MNKSGDTMNSKERYEKNNPLVIIRLPAETSEKMLAELHKRGMTLKEFLTVFANRQLSNLDT